MNSIDSQTNKQKNVCIVVELLSNAFPFVFKEAFMQWKFVQSGRIDELSAFACWFVCCRFASYGLFFHRHLCSIGTANGKQLESIQSSKMPNEYLSLLWPSHFPVTKLRLLAFYSEANTTIQRSLLLYVLHMLWISKQFTHWVYLCLLSSFMIMSAFNEFGSGESQPQPKLSQSHYMQMLGMKLGAVIRHAHCEICKSELDFLWEHFKGDNERASPLSWQSGANSTKMVRWVERNSVKLYAYGAYTFDFHRE